MRIGPQRPVNPEAIAAPQGYRVEALVTGLTFPSAVSFGPGGEIYLAESGGRILGSAGSVVALPRVLRVDPDGAIHEIGRLDYPIAGLVYRAGELLIAEDGPAPRILRVTAEGEVEILVQGLPGGGDYGLSGLALDQSGALLFGLGVRTNSGVVGLDNAARGWVSAHPDWADVPGGDLELAGVNYVTARPGTGGRTTTGSFRPFGHRCEPGDRVPGAPRCGGAVYRLAQDATEPERLAWGLRNPMGVACGPDGRVYVTEGGMEERGSRPIAGAPDNLWALQPGGYYGWPDHASGISVTDPRFRVPGHPQPRALLANAPRVAGAPAATFPSRSGAAGLDFSTSEAFGFVGDAVVALSGEWSAPAYPGEEPAGGYRVVRVNPRSGEVTDFLVNRQGGPSSGGNGGGLERPFDARFDPLGEVLYVVDLGETLLNREHGLEAYGGTGVLWRVTRIRTMVQAPERPRRGGRGETRTEQPVEAAEAVEAPEDTEAPEATEAAEVTGAAASEEADQPETDQGTAPDTVATAPEAEAAGDTPAEDAGEEAADSGAPAEPAEEPAGAAAETVPGTETGGTPETGAYGEGEVAPLAAAEPAPAAEEAPAEPEPGSGPDPLDSLPPLDPEPPAADARADDGELPAPAGEPTADDGQPGATGPGEEA